MKIKTLRSIIPYLGVIVVVALFAIFSSGKSLDLNNIKLIFEQSIMIMIASVGVLFVMTIGGLDFSQGSILGITCIVAATVSKSSIILSIVLTLLTGLIIGLCNGLLNAKLKIPSFIVTICTMFIFRGLTVYLTRKEAIQVPFKLYDFDRLEIKIAVLLIILLSGYFVYKHTKFGRACRAIGAGERAAAFSGIKVDQIKIIAFSIAGVLAGAAAYLNIIRVGTATANTGQLLETNVLIALVLGGLPVSGGARSKFSSVVLGSIILAILSNGLVMIGVDTVLQQLIKGLIFLVVVAVTVDRKNEQVSK